MECVISCLKKNKDEESREASYRVWTEETVQA